MCSRHIHSIMLEYFTKFQDFYNKFSYEEIWSYIRDHGLSSDVNLMNFLERIRTDGKISGTEKYMLTFLKELDSAFSIAVSGNYKLFTGTVDYLSHKNTTYSFSYEADPR